MNNEQLFKPWPNTRGCTEGGEQLVGWNETREGWWERAGTDLRLGWGGGGVQGEELWLKQEAERRENNLFKSDSVFSYLEQYLFSHGFFFHLDLCWNRDNNTVQRWRINCSYSRKHTAPRATLLTPPCADSRVCVHMHLIYKFLPLFVSESVDWLWVFFEVRHLWRGGWRLSITTAADQNHFSHQRDWSADAEDRQPQRRIRRVTNKALSHSSEIMRVTLCVCLDLRVMLLGRHRRDSRHSSMWTAFMRSCFE